MSEENINADALYVELVILCNESLVWAKKHGYPRVEDYPQYARARDIGELLNLNLGFAGMQRAVLIVNEKVKSKGGCQAVLLEYGWSGIGSWLA